MNKTIILVSGLLVFILAGCRQGSPKTDVSSAYNQDSLIALTRLTGDHWQLWTMKFDGSAENQITFSACDKRYPHWSADGQALYFRNNDNEAWRVDLSSGREERVMESFGLTGGAIPSPDGKMFISTRYRNQLKDSGGIWRVNKDGSDAKILTSSSGIQYDPSWSPDGRQIVYVSSHGYMTDEICIMEVDSREERKLTKNNAMEFLPVVSPDGKTIAYVSDVTDDYEIWLMDTDGGNKKKLTDSPGIDTRPFWSPDENQIIFTSNRSGSLQLWLMDADGGHQRQLTDGPPSMDPAWKGL